MLETYKLWHMFRCISVAFFIHQKLKQTIHAQQTSDWLLLPDSFLCSFFLCVFFSLSLFFILWFAFSVYWILVWQSSLITLSLVTIIFNTSLIPICFSLLCTFFIFVVMWYFDSAVFFQCYAVLEWCSIISLLMVGLLELRAHDFPVWIIFVGSANIVHSWFVCVVLFNFIKYILNVVDLFIPSFRLCCFK